LAKEVTKELEKKKVTFKKEEKKLMGKSIMQTPS